MTRRSSHRAQAQRLLAERRRIRKAAVPHGGGPARVETQTKLTLRLRDLYENSTMTVREIAAVGGITERTLYKYVERGRWKRRYRCLSRDTAVRRANSGRRYVPRPGFEPVKGAGARFIRRADRNKPVLRGIKALSKEEHAAALAEAAIAARDERLAVAEADVALAFETYQNALRMLNENTGYLEKYREGRITARRRRERLYKEKFVAPNFDNDSYDQSLRDGISLATQLVQVTQEESLRAGRRLAAVRAELGEEGGE